MRKIFITIILLNIFAVGFSQNFTFKYRVSFKDKNNSIYSISNPSAFLTNKAIARRTNQGISINELDIPVNSWYIDSLINKGASIINQSRWFNSVIISMTDTSALQQIRGFSFVKDVEQVIAFNKKKKDKSETNNSSTKSNNDIFKPFISGERIVENKNDISYSTNSAKNLDYGFAFYQIDMLQGIALHNQGFMGQGMTIAVLDAGFWQVNTISAFDSLWNNGQILGTRDFVQPGNNVFNESTHGMMVLSTMGANLPGQIVGTAPKASYWLIRTEDANSENIIEEDNWVAGAEFADSIGADIINSSLGYTVFDAPFMNHSYNDMNGKTARASLGAAIAARKGIIVVNSAGNSGSTPWQYIGAPADADSILAVGAVDINGNYAVFSSVGPSYDKRVKPDVAALGQNAVVANASGPLMGSGTSFASPILCGMVACLWQAFPSKNNQEIIDAVKRSSSQYYNPDSLLGYGIPNFPIAAILLSGNNIPNFDTENLFTVFPNPYDNDLYIAYNSVDTQRVTLEMYELTGKKILSISEIPRYTGYNSITLNNLSELKSGIYIIRLTSGAKTSIKKVIKK
jgi:hypothetical protein